MKNGRSNTIEYVVFVGTVFQPMHVQASTCIHSSHYVSYPDYKTIFRNVGGS